MAKGFRPNRSKHNQKKSKKFTRELFDVGIDMKEANIWVLNQQEKIARAKRAGDLNLAESFGEELVRSDYGRATAIQTVAANVGARSPGLSDHEFRTNDDYSKMMLTLAEITSKPERYVSAPLDRIYIPKKDGSPRPISIPSYVDRCLQALYKLALEPIGEEIADPSSYGFRPIRGTSWAIARVLNGLANPLARYGFVVEVDIKGCFDNIDHDFILQVVPVIPKSILKEWLICGYIDRESGVYYDTERGVPQGGIISPLITNIVLDGLESKIRSDIAAARTGSTGSCFCRYADDMVVFTTTEANAEVALQSIRDFLAVRNLMIKEAKTRIVNLFASTSFEFAGYKLALVLRRNRKRKVASIGVPLKAIKNLRSKVRTIIARKESLHTIIDRLNPIIRGWANYYRFAHNCMYVFRSLRYWIWKQFYRCCYRRVSGRYDKAKHTQTHEKVMNSYFHVYMEYKTWPTVYDTNGAPHILFDIASVSYQPPMFTNKAQNAYIFEDRQILDTISLRQKTAWKHKILEKSFGCCALCAKRLDINPTPYELHHILPRRFGGSNRPSNLVPLCRVPCHLKVSNAVTSRNFEEISEFVRCGVLELPISFLEELDQ